MSNWRKTFSWKPIQGYDHKETDPFGTTVYYNADNELHRTDGPAIEYANGYKEYWVNGRELSKEEFEREYGNI